MKKNNPLVSVVIPAYNAEGFLPELLEAVIKQTYKNIEIIIINDCSKDGTLRVAKDYAKKDKRIKVYDNKTNLGISANRAKGVKLARGEYICWQDADDISMKNRIKLQVEYLNSHPDVGVVGGFMKFFDETGEGVTRRYFEKDEDLRKRVFRYNPVAQPASMVRRSVYDVVGNYDPKVTISEDLEMLFRIGTKFKFANVQEVILKYRQVSSSLTRQNLKKMEKVAIEIRRKYFKHPAYNCTLIDRLYNVFQQLSMFMPIKLRFALFKIIRGDK